MVKNIAWHLELAFLRRRMRSLDEGSPAEEAEDGMETTMPQPLSGFAALRENTAFTDLD